MFDLDLLRSFVSVVDAGGFTRAGERVHRTQSTISQQIRRLEESVGRPLLVREGRGVRPTEEGEKLLSYARRILALAAEARSAVAGPALAEVVRFGIPDDIGSAELTGTIASFARSDPACRLHVTCGLSVELTAKLAADELDLALVKRDPGKARPGLDEAFAAWPEQLVWIASRDHPVRETDTIPLIAFPQGCVYRNRAVHSLEAAGRPWRIAYESPNLVGIQAAIAGGLGVALLERRAMQAGHVVLNQRDGMPRVRSTELALVLGRNPSPATLGLAETVAHYCGKAALESAAA